MAKRKYFLPKGFLSSGIHAGIKKGKKLDLGFIFSEKEANIAGFFTKSTLKSNHILYDLKLLNNKINGIIVNSGNANVFNGKEGIEDIVKITKKLGNILNIDYKKFLMASTGIIGKRLPIKNILNSLNKLTDNLSFKDKNFPLSIMTTDTKPKFITKKIKIDKKEITICGVAKGAGMISPDMATMLAFILTDINITKPLLKKASFESLKYSFNRISVDGDMSPNDSVFVMANGMGENKIINKEDGNYKKFLKELKDVFYILAEDIVKDGEGATKFIKISVNNAKTGKQAKNVCNTISNSLLFKTAMFGESANLGRIISCIGASKEKIDINKIIVKINDKIGIKNGKIIYSKSVLKEIRKKEIYIDIDLKVGIHSYFLLTTDLSYEYIKINAEYS